MQLIFFSAYFLPNWVNFTVELMKKNHSENKQKFKTLGQYLGLIYAFYFWGILGSTVKDIC